MSIKNVISEGKVPIKAWTNDIEESARQQLINCASMPFIHRHVAAMPDVHWGMGATVGSVIPTIGAVIPAAVGVDIGCGMMAVELGIDANVLPDNLSKVRSMIESAIPHGRTDNGGKNDRGGWGNTPANILQWWSKYGLEANASDLLTRHPDLLKGNINTHKHLGTLGTGNHFIELCTDDRNGTWLMLHSGSRGIGNRIGSHFIRLAKKDMERYYVQLPDKDLAYIPEGSENYRDYLRAVGWAQGYAKANRQFMMASAIKAVEVGLGMRVTPCMDVVNCHHNYISHERHFGKDVVVTRKGAISAKEGEMGIIPGSMGAKSFIVSGLGNRESFHSCSHGAGRKMSRGAAKKAFTLDDFKNQTDGVECRKDVDVIDEIPGAYKDIDEVMDNQSDLVKIVRTLKQVVCVKG